MEHEDLAGTQLSSIWESLSSDECASGSCTLLPELSCSPETNSSWLPSSHSSNSSIAFLHHQQKHFFSEDDDILIQDQLLAPNSKGANPGSPCSPLVFNFIQRPLSDQDFFSDGLQLEMDGEKQQQQQQRSHDQTSMVAAVVAAAKRVHEVPENSSPTSSTEYPPRVKNEPVSDEHCSASKRRCLDKGISDKAEAAAMESFMSLSERSMPLLGHALNTDGKPRAKRGSATDPQSVYARHRRERINERLRALQGLVPNGGKVDIVTMLEEAINYVKFLQLQVKLLSSDEHWMYAPTTYNGMNISLGMHLGIQSFMSQV